MIDDTDRNSTDFDGEANLTTNSEDLQVDVNNQPENLTEIKQQNNNNEQQKGVAETKQQKSVTEAEQTTDTDTPKTENLAVELEKEKLAQELHDATAKAQENWDLLLRVKAELENVRRRTKLDLEKAHKYGIENFAKELLHVVDSLEKGLEVSATEESSQIDPQIDSMLQGIRLTHKLFLDTLDKFGIKEINPLGEAFDPAKHEALSMQESDEIEPNNVLLVVQKGFSIHERILRPARVIVAKPTASSMPRVDERA